MFDFWTVGQRKQNIWKCHLDLYLGIFLTLYKQNKVKTISQNKQQIKQISQDILPSLCVSDRTGRGNHQGALMRVSPLPAEYFLLFAVCHSSQKKPPWCPRHCQSYFPVSAFPEVPADGICVLEYLSGIFNTREAFLLCCCVAVVLPQCPQKKLVSRKCWLIDGARQNHNYLNCHIQSYLELNKLPVLSF